MGNNKTKYIAKKDTWFKEGTEVILIDDYGNYTGLFSGTRVCQNPSSEGNWKKLNEEYQDEEVCLFEEFDIKEII